MLSWDCIKVNTITAMSNLLNSALECGTVDRAKVMAIFIEDFENAAVFHRPVS